MQAHAFLIIFFSFIFISWRLITLQYCSGFCHEFMIHESMNQPWIYMYSPSRSPLPPPSLPSPSESAQVTRPELIFRLVYMFLKIDSFSVLITKRVCVCVCVCVFNKSFWITKLRKLYFGMFVFVLFNFFKASTPFQDNCVGEIHSKSFTYTTLFLHRGY